MSTDRTDEQPMTAACPSCGSARDLYQRIEKSPAWICNECGDEFDEPIRRPAEGGSGAGYNSPLLDLDPEEVP